MSAIPAFGSGNTTLGIVFSLISSISWAVGAVLNKRLPGALEISPLMLVALQIAFSAVCLHLAVHSSKTGPIPLWVGGLRCLTLCRYSIPCITFYLFKYPPTCPCDTRRCRCLPDAVLGVLFSWLLVGDRLGTFEILGGALVVGCGASLIRPSIEESATELRLA